MDDKGTEIMKLNDKIAKLETELYETKQRIRDLQETVKDEFFLFNYIKKHHYNVLCEYENHKSEQNHGRQHQEENEESFF